MARAMPPAPITRAADEESTEFATDSWRWMQIRKASQSVFSPWRAVIFPARFLSVLGTGAIGYLAVFVMASLRGRTVLTA